MDYIKKKNSENFPICYRKVFCGLPPPPIKKNKFIKIYDSLYIPSHKEKCKKKYFLKIHKLNQKIQN